MHVKGKEAVSLIFVRTRLLDERDDRKIHHFDQGRERIIWQIMKQAD
jgi:hypothetical protein